MAKHRLINCDFINDMTNLTNNAKLLYLMLFINADDKGFVGNGEDIVKSLDNNDLENRNEINLSLLGNDYKSALNELIDKGLLYEFVSDHQKKVHLIIHWYFHNKLKKDLWTNYFKFLKLVDLVDNKYVLKKEKPLKEKEIKINENKLNEIKLNEINVEPISNSSNGLIPKGTTLKDYLSMCGVKSFNELSKEQIQEFDKYIACIPPYDIYKE